MAYKLLVSDCMEEDSFSDFDALLEEFEVDSRVVLFFDLPFFF